jgi:predicted amidohydrolase YtcJ
MSKYALVFVILSLFTAVSNAGASAEAEAVNAVVNLSEKTVYFGGDIITMEGNEVRYVEAVIEQGGKILYAGDRAGGEGIYTGKINALDLHGQTMLPGFIEPHLHPAIAAVLLSGDIVAPHDWRLPAGLKSGVEGHAAYIARIEDSIAASGTANEVLFIWGYHQLWHGELNRSILNELAPDVPVAIIHRSFHEVFLNDKAISLLGIKQQDFESNPQVDWDKGHFFEGGWLALVPKIAPRLMNPKRYLGGLAQMTQMIRSNGITTIAEQGFPSSNFDMELGLLKSEMDKNPPYDVYNVFNGTQLYGMRGGNENAWKFMESAAQKYNTQNIFMLPGQVKLFADGAIYSLAMEMKDGYSDGFKGEWMTPPSLFEEQMNFYWDKGYTINIHANGDAGIQLCLDVAENMMKRNPREKYHLTLHHMGYFTDAQAKKMKELGIEASVNPYYLWALADKYSEFGLGPERAKNLVRIKSLKDAGVSFSFHSDFGMAPLSPLTLAWTAVNRVTAKQTRVSQSQRIDVFSAMQAITINAAKTLELEAVIGSIKVGKTANFTILEENPFKVDVMHLKDIAITGVVHKGRLRLNSSGGVGSDRDVHGCIASAGYSWCAKTGQCERPWELQVSEKLSKDSSSFDNYCDDGS